jgi:hypothetical protein
VIEVIRESSMKRALTVAVAAILTTSAVAPAPAAAADQDCLKTLAAAAAQARKRTAVYQGELKGLSANPYSAGALSICNSAMARAERFYKKNLGENSMCVPGSAYIDGQVQHLFKNATITCRSEATNVIERLPTEEQAPIVERLRRNEGLPR